MKRIKILRIQSRICIGGPALHTEILSRFLPADLYQTVLVGGQLEEHEHNLYQHLRNRGLDVRVIPEMKRDLAVVQDLKAIVKLIRLIRSEKPHIVHTHTAKAGTVGRIAAIICRVPVIVHTFHGHVFSGYFSRWKTRFFILVEKLLALGTDKIVAISELQKQDLSKTYKISTLQKIELIRLGHDLDRFHSQRRSRWIKDRLGLDDNSVLAAVIGRLVPIKNFTLAIRAVARLVDQGMDVHR